MSELREKQVILSAGEEDDLLREYKSISWLAIGSLLIGLISPLVLINPILALFSIAGVIMALISLIKIRRRPDELRGRRLALAGLVLSALFGTYAASRFFSHTESLAGQGKVVADEWLAIVRNGELQKAHQLHRERKYRKHPRAAFAPYYKDPVIKQEFERFFRSQPLSQIIEIGNEGTLQYLGHSPIWEEDEWKIVVLKYELNYDRGGRRRSIPFRVVLSRRINEQSGDAEWHVFSVQKIEDDLQAG